MWSADLQARLVKSFAADDLSLSLEEVDLRLQQLLVLLPELGKAPFNPSPDTTARCSCSALSLTKLLHARLVKLICGRRPQPEPGGDRAVPATGCPSCCLR